MQELTQIIAAVCKDLFDIDVEPVLTRPDEQFGDYATNVALQIAGKLQKTPREIAEQICQNISHQSVASAEVAGPGFVNLRLTDSALIADLKFDSQKMYAGKKVVIETNNLNPFKDIHIGHAFNSIVADTIANLLEQGGAEVHRVSYHGDVGLHVGKSLWAIFDEYRDRRPEDLETIPVAERPVKLREWYARGAGLYEEDPAVKEQVIELARQSFEPDGDVKTVYEMCKAWSFEYFDDAFRRLGSAPIEKRYLESQTDKEGRAIVLAHVPDVFEQSEGAIIFRGDESEGLHTRVFISKHGTTLYEARDLGLIKLKARDFTPDASYIVTAVEQKDYFKVVLRAAELSMPGESTTTVNIPTGTVKLTTGKMSSRTGQVVTIEWLFDEIENGVRRLNEETQTVEQSSLAAIRYSMLKSRLDGDIVFDIDNAVALEGNTGPYLQYAHARASSILVKSGQSTFELAQNIELEQDERSFVRKMSEYSEAVDRSVGELMPHHICTYLYELSQAFNRFYEHNRVIGDARESLRLGLVADYATILKNGLGLLGIPAPDHM